MKFVSMGTIDNKSELVLVMVLRNRQQTITCTLMKTQFTDVHECHLASMCKSKTIWNTFVFKTEGLCLQNAIKEPTNCSY